MRSRLRLGSLITASLVFLMGITSWLLAYRADRDTLLSNATPINVQTCSVRDYWWLSKNDVVLCQRDENEHRLFTFTILNVDDLSRRPLVQLSNYVNRSAGSCIDCYFYVSPDGRSLLWDENCNTSQYQSLAGSDIDGTRVFRFRTSFKELHWSSDCQHWVEFVPSKDSDRYSAVVKRKRGVPENVSILPIAPKSPLDSTGCSSGKLLRGDRFLIDTTWQRGVQSLLQVEFLELDLGRRGSVMCKYSVHLPENDAIEDIVYSPKGDRVAWLIARSSVAPIDAWLQRLIPSYKVPQLHTVGVWISQINGNDMHELGHVTTNSSPYEGNPTRIVPQDVRWLPDGKHLSFSYNGNLWRTISD